MGLALRRGGLAGQALQHAAVDVLERLQIGQGDVFVDLVDGGVGRAEFDDLGADAGDEATVAGAAAGG